MKKISTLFTFILVLAAGVITSAKAQNVTETFDSYWSTEVVVSKPHNYGPFIYDTDGDLEQGISPNAISLSAGNPGSFFSIKTVTGNPFQLITLGLDEAAGHDVNATVTGYRGGSAVTSGVPITIKGNQTNFDFTGQSGFNNVDEVRITGTNLSLFIEDWTYDLTLPTTINSISRSSFSPTNTTSVSYKVSFAGTMKGLSASNFELAPGSISDASITNVSGSTTTWTVTVNTGTGNGTIGLNFINATGTSGVTNSLPFTGDTYTITKTGPTITNAVAGSGHLKAGNVITITLIYSGNVTVTGAPYLPITLNTGTVHAVYGDGSGTNQLAFRYTITGTDEDDDGIVVGNSVTLNGGTIQDDIGNNASTSFAAPSGSNIFVDNIAPTVLSLTAKDPTPTNATSVRYDLKFSENIFNSDLDANDFTLTKTGGVTGAIASISNSDGGPSNASTFVVTITGVSGNGTLKLDFNGSGTGVNDQAHNPLSGGASGDTYNIDNTAPAITSASVGTGHLNAGLQLSVLINYNSNVTVTGTPYIPITLNSGTVNAVYSSGSHTSQLLFLYTITAADEDDDGIATGNAIVLNGGTIKDDSNNDAALSFTAPSGSNTFVDNIAPTALSLTANDASPTKSTSVTYALKFSEKVFQLFLDAGDFTLIKTGNVTGTIAGIDNSSGSPSNPISIITVSGVSGTGTLQLNFNSSGTGITDLAENPMAGGATGDTYNIDNTAPAAPTGLALADGSDSGTPGDGITHVKMPTITGTAEDGSTVTLYDTNGSTVLGSAPATGGTFSIPTSMLSEGDHTITATATDALGNTGIASGGLAVTINTTIPTATITSVPAVEETSNSFDINYTGASGNPDLYSVDVAATNQMPGFIAVSNFSLHPNTITVDIPNTAHGTYDFILSVRNQAAGNSSVDIPFSLTVNAPPPPPTLTATGTLIAFSSCLGSPSSEQSFKISGTNLTTDITVTAPDGFEISKTTGTGFTSQLTFTEASGTVGQQDVFVRIAAATTGTPSGDIKVTSAGATEQDETITGLVHDIPTIALGTIADVSQSATSFNLPYSGVAPAGTYIYYITRGARRMPDFNEVNGFALVPNISVNLPPSPAPGIYDFNLTIVNTDGGCSSAVVPFTLTVLADDASLQSLATTAAGFSPSFDPGINTGYTASVTNGTVNTTVTPTVADANATVKVRVNGSGYASVLNGTPSEPLPLNVGANTIDVQVTAQDETTQQTYTLTVNRAASNNALLTVLTLDPGATLTRVGGPDRADYTATVPNSTATIKVKPITSDAGATLTVNGNPSTPGAESDPITLNSDTTSIAVTVTAGDGITKNTYRIVLTRAPSNNARLTVLTLNPGAKLTRVSGPDHADYTATVSNSTASVKVKPITSDAGATLTVNGNPSAPGAESDPITLNADTTSIAVTVTAPDGVTKNTYRIVLTRAPSNNARLTVLTLNPGATLTRVSGPDYADYTATVPNSTATIKVKPITSDPMATLTVNGNSSAPGAESAPITLNADTTSIAVTVTAQDGTTRNSYVIKVTRLAPPPAVMAYEQEQATPAERSEVVVHGNVSPNGDGNSDVMQIDGIGSYPDNRVQIMSRSGNLVFETKGYDNTTKVFDGHSNDGKLQQAGTYFYSLEYKVGSETKHKTGYIVLKY